jgi:hypothetical protein
MRLNIGCGKQYIPGYINVDLFEDGIADIVAPADSLDFVTDNSVEEIVTYQLIEHLGLINFYKTLAHWAVKLKPGGKLSIETPDLEKSLEVLVNKKSEKDLDWLFGVSDPGQVHNRPFFSEELIKILKLIGFEKIQIKEPLGFWKINTFRLEGKTGNSDFRARVIEKWCELKPTQGTFYELPFDKIYTPPSEKILAELSIVNPKLSLILLDALKNQNKKVQSWKKIIKEFDLHKLNHFLYLLLLHTKRKPNEQKQVVKNITTKVKKLIIKSLKNGMVNLADLKIKNNLKDFTKLLDKYSYITNFFSTHNINELSMLECALGVKAFSNKKYGFASKHFKISTQFNSQNTISWWNLARTEWINDNKNEAEIAFDNAFELSKDKNILNEKARSIPIKRPVEISYAAEIQT